MNEQYICVSSGVNENGEPYSAISKIVSFASKKNGSQGTFIDLKNKKYLEDVIDVGTIVTIKSEIIKK